MQELSTNQRMNSRDRKYIAKKFIKRVRKDVGYLLKPRPMFMPFKFHVWLLSKLLYLDNKSLSKICLTSSSKVKRT